MEGFGEQLNLIAVFSAVIHLPWIAAARAQDTFTCLGVIHFNRLPVNLTAIILL